MFFEFISEQWMLVAAWLLLLITLLNYENRKAGKGVTPQQLSDMVNREDAVVLDIRDHSDYSQGHIVNAVNMPLRDVEKRMSELFERKEKPVIVVCKMGQSATGVTKQLKAAGFTAVYKLTGGLAEWNVQNLPLVKKEH